jgi:hypothetical protein
MSREDVDAAMADRSRARAGARLLIEQSFVE